MSHLVASAAPMAGAHTVKRYAGFGILGAAIPSTGDNGGSPVLNDGPLPDAEYHWRVETSPASGTLSIFPDLTFEHIGAADGVWPWAYRLFEDGVSQGTATVTNTFGVGNATAPGATLSGTASLAAGPATGEGNATAPGASLTGTAALSAGAASGSSAATAPGATLTGTASLAAGAAEGEGNASAAGASLTGPADLAPGAAEAASPGTASGATLTGTASLAAGSASGNQPATAPGASFTGSAALTPGAATATNPDASAPGATLTGSSSLVAGSAHDGAAILPGPARYRVAANNRRRRVAASARNYTVTK